MCVLSANDDIITMINATNAAVITGLENHRMCRLIRLGRGRKQKYSIPIHLFLRHICCLFAFRFLHNLCLKCCKRWVFSRAVSILCHSIMANYHLLEATTTKNRECCFVCLFDRRIHANDHQLIGYKQFNLYNFTYRPNGFITALQAYLSKWARFAIFFNRFLGTIVWCMHMDRN